MFQTERQPGVPGPESPFQKGDLKYVILGLLDEKPGHGYEIINRLKERSHGCYSPSPGAVYPTLHLLEEMGYVEGARSDGRKTYSVTGEGRAFLAGKGPRAESVERMMNDSWSSQNAVEMREILAEIGRMGRLVGQHFRGLSPNQVRRLREVVVRANAQIEGIVKP